MKLKITSKQLNEINNKLIEEIQINNLKLPNFIVNSIESHKTSLGEHPVFPPSDEIKFEEKILLKRFNELGRSLIKITDVEKNKKALTSLLNNYIITAKKIEADIKDELEKICYEYVCDKFNLEYGELYIECNLSENVKIKNNVNDSPKQMDDIDFDELDELDLLEREVYKRRLINSLVMGVSIRLSDDFKHILDKLYELNPKLPELYHNISVLINYLNFVRETKPSNDNIAGIVEVDLSNENPKIKSEAIIFPILIFETVKGVMELLSSHGLPKNKKYAEYIINKADFTLAENWDKRFGVGLWDLICDKLLDNNLKYDVFVKLIETPVDEFNKTLREIFAGTKKGVKLLNDIENIVSKEKHFNEFDSILSNESSDYSIGADDGGYFSIEELGGIIKDSVTTSTAGDYTYDVPVFGDAESNNHTNMIANGQKTWNVN